MMKHIKKDSHAFLFFLGGLFLMLVGPSLIPTTNAATMTERIVYNNNIVEKGALLYAPEKNFNTFTLELNQLGIDSTSIVKAIMTRTTKKNNNLTYSFKKYLPHNSSIRVGFGQKTISIYNSENISTYFLNLINDKEKTVEKIKLEVYTNLEQFMAAKSTHATNVIAKNLANVATNVATTTKVANPVGVPVATTVKNSHAAADGPFLPSYQFITSAQALADANITPIDNKSTLTMVVKYFTQVFTTLFDAIQNNLATIMKYLAYTNTKQDIIIEYMSKIMTAKQIETLGKDIANLNAEYLNIQYNNEGQYLNTNVLQKETQKETHAAAGSNNDNNF